MKKIFMVMVLLLSLSVVGIVCAEEGSSTGKGYYLGDLTILPMTKGYTQINYDVGGIITSDSGKGLFHNASERILGSFQVVKGVIEDSGFIVATLTNGDNVFMTYKGSGTWSSPDKPPVVKGTCIIVGGTGKVAGITGGIEFTRYTLRPPAKGKSASFSTSKINWKIPEPKK